MSKALPTPSKCFNPKNEKDAKVIAPTGVDALNSISAGGTSGEPESRMPSDHFTGDAGRLTK